MKEILHVIKEYVKVGMIDHLTDLRDQYKSIISRSKNLDSKYSENYEFILFEINKAINEYYTLPSDIESAILEEIEYNASEADEFTGLEITVSDENAKRYSKLWHIDVVTGEYFWWIDVDINLETVCVTDEDGNKFFFNNTINKQIDSHKKSGDDIEFTETMLNLNR